MPIPFNSIPEHVRIEVFKKMTLNDFRQFHECSCNSYSFARNLKKTLPVTVPHFYVKETVEGLRFIVWDLKDTKHEIVPNYLIDIPVRITINCIVVESELTSAICALLTNFSLKRIVFAKNIICSANELNNLLSIGNAKECGFSAENLAPVYLRIPAIRNLKWVSADTFLNDDDLLHLKAPVFHLSLTHISSYGVNFFLKEWLNGKRTAEHIMVKTLKHLDIEACLEGTPHCYWPWENFELYAIGETEGDRIMIRIEANSFGIRTEQSLIAQGNLLMQQRTLMMQRTL